MKKIEKERDYQIPGINNNQDNFKRILFFFHKWREKTYNMLTLISGNKYCLYSCFIVDGYYFLVQAWRLNCLSQSSIF